MCLSKADGKMEGWLYTIRHNRFGLQYSCKRYFVLRDNSLISYKCIPSSANEEPDRRASLDSCIRVKDNGRESFHRKVLFIFTLYNTSNHLDQLKLGASSSEEAAKWIRSLQDASLKGSPFPDCEFVSHSQRGLVRLDVSKRSRRKNSVDWTHPSSVNAEEKASDVIAPSPWKIFGCQNGLRLFKEANDWDSRGRHWDDHPAIMAVSTIDATSEDIFHSLMSLGPLRSEWDFSFYKGNMVEHLDGHTDIIHLQLYSDWLPWGMKRRDLLLRRYWRREEDGTYVILYHSVYHKKCLPRRGYVRACVKSGGYVVSPVNDGKQSLVKHMLAIDWRCWNSYMRPSSARSITVHMVERLAALREMFKAKKGYSFSEISTGEMMGNKPSSKVKTRSLTYDAKELEEIVKTEVNILKTREEVEKSSSAPTSLMDLHDTSDEFFDVLEPNEPTWFDSSDSERHSSDEIGLQGHTQLKLPSAVGLVKKLQDLAAQKKGYMDLQEVAMEEEATYFYGATLQKDTTFTLPCSWATADPSTFLIRGKNYLKNHKKEKAKGTLTQMIGADWISSNKRENDLGGRLGGIVQQSAAEDKPAFFFIVNIQVPGSAMYSLALYYMLKTPLEEHPLLHSFVNGDDAYRNSRFKLIPHISKGSWIVKQSVGKKACLVGQALEARYFRGENYLEIDVDVGSSTVARGVTNLVLGYLNNLVIEMAFLIQANTEEELPEALLGTCRLNYLDVSKSVQESR